MKYDIEFGTIVVIFCTMQKYLEQKVLRPPGSLPDAVEFFQTIPGFEGDS